MTRRQFIALLGLSAAGAGVTQGQMLVGGSARLGGLHHGVGKGFVRTVRTTSKTYPLDDMEDFLVGDVIDGASFPGWNWGGAYVERPNYARIVASDNLEAYSVDDDPGMLANGGTGWPSAFINLADNYVRIIAQDDLETYTDGSALTQYMMDGWGFGGGFQDRVSYVRVLATDDLESYTNGASLNGLNSGSGFSGAFIDR